MDIYLFSNPTFQWTPSNNRPGGDIYIKPTGPWWWEQDQKNFFPCFFRLQRVVLAGDIEGGLNLMAALARWTSKLDNLVEGQRPVQEGEGRSIARPCVTGPHHAISTLGAAYLANY